jgi:hypothetical protein
MASSQNCTHENGLAAGASLKLPVNISASTTSGVLVSAQNPEGVAVIGTLAYIHVKTQATGACTVDFGVAATAISADTLIDGISVNSAPNQIYDNILNAGTHGLTRQYVAAGSYFTVAVASGDANGLSADFYVNYQLMSGGESVPSL